MNPWYIFSTYILSLSNSRFVLLKKLSQALLVIWAVDERIASCLMVHFYVDVFE